MKKAVLPVVCVLLICLMATSVFATDSFTVGLKPAKTSGCAGESIEIVVSVSEFEECKGGQVTVSFDKQVFERSNNSWILATSPTMNDPNGEEAVFAYSNKTTVSGNVYKFTLKIKDGAPLGSYNVTVKVDLKDGNKIISASKTISIAVVCNHKYDNSCDTSCNLCGETRKITHSWDKGKVTTKATCTASGEKLYTCKVCGGTKTESIKKTGHKYDNACDKTCNNCGESRKVTHAYESKWTTDAAQHWYACSVCGDKKDAGEHTYGAELTSTAAGHGHACTVCGHMQELQEHSFDHACDGDCNDCGYQRETEHDYSNQWHYDANGHWHACTVCGDELEMVPHEPGEEATETTDQVCLECGCILKTAANHQHTVTEKWLTDENCHWFVCNCGVQTEPEEHTWNAGVIDLDLGVITHHCTACGYSREEIYVPPTEPPETQPPVTTEPTEPPATTEPIVPDEPAEEFPLWIVLAVALGLSVIGNIFLICCLVSSKKTGKFSQ